MKINRPSAIRLCRLVLTVATLWTFSFAHSARAGETWFSPTSSDADFKQDSSETRLANGIEVKRGEILLRVVALRDDVLRIRLADNGAIPEDASWAVASEIRNAKVDVISDSSTDSYGFHTRALRVRIERSSLRLSVSDLEGNILQEDAPGWPVEFHGGAFRVYKKMPVDEHYFGLGDKVGPLDRRGQSFRLWNTDSFLFQESTDPIYKSIPFFLTMRAGKSTGFLLILIL